MAPLVLAAPTRAQSARSSCAKVCEFAFEFEFEFELAAKEGASSRLAALRCDAMRGVCAPNWPRANKRERESTRTDELAASERESRFKSCERSHAELQLTFVRLFALLQWQLCNARGVAHLHCERAIVESSRVGWHSAGWLACFFGRPTPI